MVSGGGEVRIIPWSGEDSPSERTLREELNREGLQGYTWSNGPGFRYSAHQHPYAKVIYVISGDITFRMPESDKAHTLHAGDRMELPSGVLHEAVVGSVGVVCLEAHRQ